VGVGVPGSTFQVGVGAALGVNVELGIWNVAVGVGVPGSKFQVGVGNGVGGATVCVGIAVGVELGTWNTAVGAGAGL